MLKAFKSYLKDSPDGEFPKIRLGVCAMDKKARSKPMREILGRLPDALFDVIIFGDDCILNDPIQNWPEVEVLIAFYSHNFPTEKALEYVHLRKPFMLNDLEMDAVLKDRRRVYELLEANGINVPFHVYCERDNLNHENNVEEYDEYIVVNGIQINKPLVEKPVDAEDHNIYIYYPISAGGGSKRLFRKVNDRSSEFYPRANELRRSDSYIYEEFIVTQGTDVKVYTVGPDYGHAEARKSPVVDGRVNRDAAGLEVRYPVILSPTEKEIARKIVLAFKQTVCGFDILRVHGKSYCCDVNGFSFVKNSRKYYDDASQILTEIVLTRLRPQYSQASLSTRAPILRTYGYKDRDNKKNIVSSELQKSLHRQQKSITEIDTLSSSNLQEQQYGHLAKSKLDGESRSRREITVAASFNDESVTINNNNNNNNNNNTNNVKTSTPGKNDNLIETGLMRKNSQENFERLSSDDSQHEELRCVIAVTRHADRTPKQKMKVKVTLPEYLDFFHRISKSPKNDLKVKSKAALTGFLKITRDIIDNKDSHEEDPELYTKLQIIRDVLERWEISGINRKLQMKPLKWDTNNDHSENTKSINAENSSGEKMEIISTKYDEIKGRITKSDRSNYNHNNLNIGIEDNKSSTSNNKLSPTISATEILLILKWGGDLTPLGRAQAETMGARFRHQMYPDNAGGGVLRLHATYRHDLKIKASDEGRVIKTAAAFAKGLLELEGQLTPIIASLVTIEEKNRQMLDHGGNKAVKEELDVCKIHLNKIQRELDVDEAFIEEFSQSCPLSIKNSMLSLKSPLNSLRRLHVLIGQLCAQLQGIVDLEVDNNKNEGYDEIGDAFDHQSMDIHHRSIERSTSEDMSQKLYLGETYALMLDRWEKLNKDFFNRNSGMYDLSKVPDVYDMIRYDILHNSHVDLDGMKELYDGIRTFENTIVPQEYGSNEKEKCIIGSKVCGALLEKIKYDLTVSQSDTTHDMRYLLDHSHAEDLEINSLGRVVRTRLYFTSESHMHTLLNVLRHAGPHGNNAISKHGLEILENIPELSYLTQIVIRLFEDRIDPTKFRCEISLSPGATSDIFEDKSPVVAPYVTLNKSISCEELLDCLSNAILVGKELPYNEKEVVK
jgi:inositol hexakisphosphate/diphosphoinositol-pentakisphosphate kinase